VKPEEDSAAGTQSGAGHQNPAFVTTQWSQVLKAARNDSTRASSALATLCSNYWYPLYSYARRRGYGPDDAKDLTQGFFARLLQQKWLAQADPARGRFRTFLLTAMSHFLANEWDKARARKRGGDVQIVSFQMDSAETRYSHEPADSFTPDQAYERRWAITVLERVMEQLKQEHVAGGKAAVFELLKPCLIGEGTAEPYAGIALKLNVSESAVKVLVHRLRKRYRQLLREEIANTLANSDGVDEEMRHLFEILAG
jgi:RNA polymerase sigma factor (sigma-70 family)